MRSLYISHNGMAEGLGHSQVLPYLRGLARRGVEIELLSFELPTTTPGAREEIAARLRRDGIAWRPLTRKLGGSLPVKAAEAMRGVMLGLRAAFARRPDIVHGRSYFPTAVGDAIAALSPPTRRTRVVFDCRGMIGDEFVDAGYWTRDRLEYRLVKRYEARIFHRAEGVVVLTEALKSFVLAQEWMGPRTQIEVIPTCVDLDAFRFDEAARTRIRRELGVDDRLVLVYSGSLSSWYRDADVARFAGILKRRAGKPIAFLLLTPSQPDTIVQRLEAEGLSKSEIVVRRVPPPEMASWLSAGDIGLSFIKSCFSKKGSSPTKVAEYLACGLPVVLNGDIGDQAELARETEMCVVVDGFGDDELIRAADAVLPIASRDVVMRVARGREIAERRFGLEGVGVTRYERLYRAIVAGS